MSMRSIAVAVAQFKLVRAATSDENISEMMDARALTLKILVLFLRIFLYVMTFQKGAQTDEICCRSSLNHRLSKPTVRGLTLLSRHVASEGSSVASKAVLGLRSWPIKPMLTENVDGNVSRSVDYFF